MALDDDIRLLSGVRLFESFTQDQLRLLAFGAEPMTLSRGRKLYREDDDADCAYVVLSGSFLLYRESPDGPVPVGTAGPGAMLGELALIADTRRLTSATAETESRIIRLSRRMFRRILEEYPETAAMLRDRLVDDLQDLVGRIEALAPRFS